jgi:hypothetical protein
MRLGSSDPDVSFANLHRLGWSAGEFGTARGFTIELSRPGRMILATAPTYHQAWHLAEWAAVGDGGYDD